MNSTVDHAYIGRPQVTMHRQNCFIHRKHICDYFRLASMTVHESIAMAQYNVDWSPTTCFAVIPFEGWPSPPIIVRQGTETVTSTMEVESSLMRNGILFPLQMMVE